jgi:hypothetical protein
MDDSIFGRGVPPDGLDFFDKIKKEKQRKKAQGDKCH